MASSTRLPGSWKLVLLALILIIGLRFKVGGDWFNYLNTFKKGIYESQFSPWWNNDPGYRVLEWLSMRYDWGIYGVNVMSSVIFSYGLLVFCRHLPRPWLALAVAVPYLVVMLGMGYSRQGVALGCVMVGLCGLGQGRALKFIAWTVLGATFHKTAVVMLPMAALAASHRRWVTAVWVTVVAATAYGTLLEDSVQKLSNDYLVAQYQSEGTLIRLLMNNLPAALLLVKRDRFAMTLPQQRLWFWFAAAAMGLLGAYFFSPSSTAIDRIGLYLLPLQLMVFAYLPEALGRHRGSRQNLVLAVLVYYAVVEFVWFNFATHSRYWLPYRWYPFELMFN
ncbi:MAG: EpsG family protein [Limnohabitans sp.]